MTAGLLLRVAAGLVAAVLLTGESVLPASADPPSPDEIRITLEVEEQTLEEALATLASLIGQDIEVKGRIHERKVSAVLDGATLDESLKQLLHPQSHVVLWTQEGRLTLHVLGEPETDETSVSDGSEPLEAAGELPPSLFPGGPETLPPERPGDLGLTAADVAHYRSFSGIAGPLDLEVVPSSSPDLAGVTRAELAFEAAGRRAPDPSEIEILPPETPGEAGLTLAEFRILDSQRRPLPPSEIEVLPPDIPGGVGLTLEELRSLPRPAPPQRPLSEEVPPWD